MILGKALGIKAKKEKEKYMKKIDKAYAIREERTLNIWENAPYFQHLIFPIKEDAQRFLKNQCHKSQRKDLEVVEVEIHSEVNATVYKKQLKWQERFYKDLKHKFEACNCADK